MFQLVLRNENVTKKNKSKSIILLIKRKKYSKPSECILSCFTFRFSLFVIAVQLSTFDKLTYAKVFPITTMFLLSLLKRKESAPFFIFNTLYKHDRFKFVYVQYQQYLYIKYTVQERGENNYTNENPWVHCMACRSL